MLRVRSKYKRQRLGSTSLQEMSFICFVYLFLLLYSMGGREASLCSTLYHILYEKRCANLLIFLRESVYCFRYIAFCRSKMMLVIRLSRFLLHSSMFQIISCRLRKNVPRTNGPVVTGGHQHLLLALLL